MPRSLNGRLSREQVRASVLHECMLISRACVDALVGAASKRFMKCDL